MRILVINTDFLPDELRKIAEWLSGHSIYLLSPSHVASRLREEIDGMYEEILEYTNDDHLYFVADRAHHQRAFDFVLGHVEPDLLPAARLRRHWHIAGPSVESIRAYRDKGVMKELLHAAGIRVPKFALISSGADLVGFVRANGYPVLTKPRSARRSLGIQVLRTETDLELFLERGICGAEDALPNLMVEELVKGTMYHVDGLVIDEAIKLIWPSEYITKCDGFGDGRHIASVSLASESDLASRLVEYVRQVITALPSPRNFAFHAEVFETGSGELKLCEIAARPGAGPVVSAFEQIFDVDIKRQAILSNVAAPELGIAFRSRSYPNGACGWLIFPNQIPNSRLKRLPTFCPVANVLSYKTFAQEGDEFGDDRVVLSEIVFSAENQKSVKDSIDAASVWFYGNVQYG